MEGVGIWKVGRHGKGWGVSKGGGDSEGGGVTRKQEALGRGRFG